MFEVFFIFSPLHRQSQKVTLSSPESLKIPQVLYLTESHQASPEAMLLELLSVWQLSNSQTRNDSSKEHSVCRAHVE